jgi:hypothetical protein
MRTEMKLMVSSAAPHLGSAASYVERSARALGYAVESCDGASLLEAQFESVDYLICVDSGKAFDFKKLFSKCPEIADRTAMWFIDYRHNKDRVERGVTDRENAQILSDAGAHLFFAQIQDKSECMSVGLKGGGSSAVSFHMPNWL